MRVAIWIQRPGLKKSETIGGRLKTAISASGNDTIRAAAAYVTISGVRTLLACLPPGKLKASSWLVGLDDAITQPKAIDLLLNQPHAKVRVVSHGGSAARFHPKVFMFGRSQGGILSVACVGSANLTGRAMANNSEAVALLSAENKNEKASLHQDWDRLWELGHALAPGELDAYRKRYQAARKAREAVDAAASTPTTPASKNGVASADILASDDAELDPSQAKTCWIECGAVTAQGRELEIKGEQGLFFGVQPSGEDFEKFLNFKLASGAVVPLRLKFQANQMWRVQLNKQIPEVETGLRAKLPSGRLARSDYVAIFTRTVDAGMFGLKFIKDTSSEYKRIRSRSSRTGTCGRTRAGKSGRAYGWC